MNAIAIAARFADAPERFQDLYPCDAAGDVTTALSTDAARNFLHAGIAAGALGHGFTAGHGSNAWVIGPERTEMGHAILCNDPHLRMTLPSVWYLMHLNALPAPNQSDGYEAWGATIPGCPGVHVGHNRWIAWGITAALCDDVEIYREKVHRLEPDRYQIDGEWHLMTRQRETIGIKAGGAVERTIRWTRHGPVISDFSHHTLSSDVLSLRWTAHEPSEDFRGLYQLNCARDWGEFVRALSHQSAPTLNFMYADRSGNIGFSLAGRVPLRNRVPSVLATEGWRSENEWRGFVPFADLPRLFNPPQGAIANANNPIVDDAYPFYLSRFFEPPFRVRRIYQMLAARKIHSVQHMIAAQRDEISLHARELIATLNAELAAIRSHGSDIGAAADRLLSWDGHCGTDSIAATIFHVFHHALIKTLLMPCLGEELFITYVEIFNQSISPIEKILRSPDSPWFEGRSRAELARSALVCACAEISEYLGPEQERWQWGRLHTLTLNHPFSRVSLLRPLFSAGIFPAAGDNFTVNMGFYRHSNPYEQIVGPSMRMIVESRPTFRSWFILSSGQSGHPFSKHYRDQTARWQRQEYIQLSGTEEEIRALPLLSLKPAG
jgi:penicillin amidase